MHDAPGSGGQLGGRSRQAQGLVPGALSTGWPGADDLEGNGRRNNCGHCRPLRRAAGREPPLGPDDPRTARLIYRPGLPERQGGS